MTLIEEDTNMTITELRISNRMATGEVGIETWVETIIRQVMLELMAARALDMTQKIKVWILIWEEDKKLIGK